MKLCLASLFYHICLDFSPLTSYYETKEVDKVYICSLPKDHGLHTCNLPPTKYNGMECKAAPSPNSDNLPTNETCVNWNQYYTDCRASPYNPGQGAMSFDNIGLAWIAIFLVSIVK